MSDISQPRDGEPTISPANAGANAQADAHFAARAADEAARRGTEAARQGGQAAAETVRRGADVGADLARQGARAGIETARRNAEIATEAARRSAQDAAQTIEQVSRKMAEATRGTSADVSRFFVVPNAAEGGLRDAQQAVAGLVAGVVQTNLRATQELLRLADPAAVVELQQRFVHEYLDTLMAGTATLVRAVRRTADETLRPLEEQVERNRRAQGDRQDHRTAAE